jgi:hypothetical protein
MPSTADPDPRIRPIAAYLAAHERLALGAAFVGGLLVRLPFVTTDQRVTADPQLLVNFAEQLRLGGLGELIDRTGLQVLYPPLSTLALWLTGLVGNLLSGWLPPPQTELVLIKAVAIAGDLGLAWLMARLLRERGAAASVAGAAAILFNPALWYLSTVWGQIDSVDVLLMVASVAILARGDSVSAWASWVAAVAWKLQALTLAPILAVRTLGPRAMRKRVGAAISVVGLLAAGVLAASGRLADYLPRLWPRTPSLDVSAFNLWYFAVPDLPGWQPAVIPSIEPGVGSLVGTALVGGVVVVVAAAMLRSPAGAGLALPAVTMVLAAFLFLGGMHERYLLSAIPFAVLVMTGWEDGRVDRSAALAFAALTATQTLNLVAVGSPAPTLWTNVFGHGSSGPLGPPVAALGFAAAATNLIVLIWSLQRLARRGSPVRSAGGR